MSGVSPHIIGKVNIEFALGKTDSAFTITDQLKEQAVSNIRKVLERIPNAESRTIKIDHIELDLELHDPEEFSAIFETQFERQVLKLIDDNGIKVAIESDMETDQSLLKNSWDKLLYYLQNGFLPWNVGRNDQLELIQTNEYFSRNSETCIQDLSELFKDVHAMRRFCFELPMSFLNKIVNAVPGYWHKKYRSYFSQFENILAAVSSGKLRHTSARSFQRVVLFAMLYQDALMRKLPSNEAVTEQLLETLYIFKDHIVQAKKVWAGLEYTIELVLRDEEEEQHSVPYTKLSDERKKILQAAINLKEEGKINFSFEDVAVKELDNFFSSNSSEKLENQASFVVSQLQENTIGEEKAENSSKETIYVNNAGLVLLHPYLLALFQELKLCDHQHFYHNHSRNRAVSILQFLAGFGSNDYKGLALSKVLCGMEIRDVLHGQFRMSQKIRNECSQLLNAVIRNWTVLKNTSIEGLQEGFLRREGILEFKDHRYKLIVERKGHDILLENLPWPIGIVKLPWMKYIVMVDW